MNAADAFTWLAAEYYQRTESIRADVREPMTIVWNWREDFLTPTPVPTRIYEEVMCMRCGESALQLDSGVTQAVALWLASNFRREARLGMDVESEELDPRNSADGTRPAGFLRGVYYARSAGPRYCHPVLGLAVRDREAAVALGALAALKATAGASSLVGLQDERQPLVEALTFPDTTVRIKAALTLGQALPLEKFPGGENVSTVLAEALAQTGHRHAIIVDTDGENRNRVAEILTGMDVSSVTGSNLLEVLAIARLEQPDVDLIVLASDISQPNLAEAAAVLRRDFRFANTPVIVLARREQELMADRIAASEVQMGVVSHRATATDVAAAWDEAASRVGRVPTTPETALALALDAAETLRLIAISRTPAFDFAKAEPALIGALSHPAAELQIKAAQVLAYASSAAAQRAVARVALSGETDMALRLPAFASLAESAKRQGNLLESYEVDALRELTMKSDDPVIKTAASRALGALNLPTHDATTIIIGTSGS
jgi:CheY-like chemotaxis protein